MGIGSRIRQERLRQNLDLKELAKLSGMPERTVADIEREISSPRADNLKKLIISLGCSADQIMFDDDEMTEDGDLALLVRELGKTEEETRQTVKRVIRAMLVQERVFELERIRAFDDAHKEENKNRQNLAMPLKRYEKNR
ncbi:helix-turn-helix domain-containing protein [Pseudomonas prosekii]|uniref:Helix-turn-helix n=1 Tax=Pseudomonas prosekii TaxID=1148509 RepID=A0A1H2BW11_9PSED|nr:helix-turn-helix transcriptional regulator [Pseudomonas prosekii]SDT62418.1 Helix-turn-helix [Pseudomonas prosekii]SDT62532.1 Helix-turn-helix [Pseudomonas prosekii]